MQDAQQPVPEGDLPEQRDNAAKDETRTSHAWGSRSSKLGFAGQVRANAPKEPPPLFTKLVGYFILASTLCCAGYALYLQEYLNAVVVLAAGSFLAARLTGMLGN